ncbi:hypothetical protein J3R30DRAFT_946732 [Lentinula aciculospora]|uniref:Vacuolar import and degradation protein 21 n=1 Tax=Lentinula aciculospora TaxID=153920 RepID=A0A9W9AQU2_9AGAR|nr:hypothetical protein J3R30DRAFT_812986 [Lentinula aciculospora]KAJ4488503.1 hypothetical protein J3R30DRAFT_946732 [Lentinula aciculospora]
MSEDSLDSYVEQRIAQLATISEKRNTLLTEMYRMMRKRTNVGATVPIDDDKEDDLHAFLSKYDLKTHPDTGFISHLSEIELFEIISPEESLYPSPGSLHASPELKDHARRSESGSSEKRSMASTQTTPAASAPGASTHSDSEDELDIIRSSSSPVLPIPGMVTISDSIESVQSIPVGGSTDESTGRTLAADRATTDVIRPSPTASPKEHAVDVVVETSTLEGSSKQPMQGVVGSRDIMDIDKANVKLPLSFSLPLVSEVPESSDASNPALSKQLQIDPSPLEPLFEMDIDMESSQTVDARAKTYTSPITLPTPRYREAMTSLNLPGPSRLASTGNSPEQFTSNTSLLSSPVFIPVPPSSFHSVFHGFDFSTVPLTPPPAPPVSPTRHQMELHYTLPPLDALPADFRTKSKKIKQKKKEREREKAENRKDKEGKDDWVPWGLTRWNATIRTNPVYKRVARATKCLSTRDWAIAMTELKVIRAVDRIETLKSGRWSFRQPKKQRTSGGITKTHWDYLMDEMKWMRTDFREERKWKMALAYNLSTSVLEWHAAGTQEKRLKRGISVHWKPPQQAEAKDQIMDDIADVPADPIEIETPTTSGPTRPSSALLNLDYGSDDEDDEEQEKDVDDGLDTPAMVEEFLVEMNQSSYGEEIGFKDLQLKIEEVDDNSALQSGSMDIDHSIPAEIETVPRSGNGHKPGRTLDGLKSTSDDPMFLSMSTSTNFSSNHSPIPHSKSSKINLYTPLREKIAHSDVEKLFLDFDDFRITTTDPSSDKTMESLLPPSDLSDIFPDFQPYAMFGLAAPTSVDGKKKSEKKSDRDDPVNKRVDEVAYSKLYPASTFMFTKPTLVGALQPSKHLRGGRWIDLDESPISVEYEALQLFRLPDEFNHGIFEHKIGPITIATPAIHSVPPTSAVSSPAAKFKEPSKRAMEHLWSASDDLLLKSLAERYPNNWALVSECYNASKVTIKSDRRTSKDCQERWRDRWSPAATQRLMDTESNISEATPPPATTSPLANIGGSRGVKRFANGSISTSTAPTISTGSGSEPKKRRRHAMVQDAVRRSTKKRNEAVQKNNVRKSATMHESHNDFSNLTKMSPAEISRRKADRDLQQSQELQVARNRALAGPNGTGTRTPNGQQPAAGQPGGANGSQRASVSGVSAPPVAQIRSQQVPISQQQRAATPLVAGNSRMSPQQQMLAQQVQRAQNAIQGPIQAVTQAQAQAHVQAQLALSHALAQAQVAQAAQGHTTIDAQTAAALRGNLQQALAQNGINGNAQLSPPYTSRDATSSPAHASPPRSTGTPSNGSMNSPRPPSAQAQSHQTQSQGSTQLQVGMPQNGQIGAINIPQARNIQGHYYLPNVSASYTPEQLHQSMLRMQQAQQLQQAQQSQSQPSQPQQ